MSLPHQWWRWTEATCPACGANYSSRGKREGPWVQRRCLDCDTTFLVLCYALTPWWRRWGLGSRWITEDAEKHLPAPDGGPFR